MPYKDSDLVPVAMIGLAPSVIVVPANPPFNERQRLVGKPEWDALEKRYS